MTIFDIAQKITRFWFKCHLRSEMFRFYGLKKSQFNNQIGLILDVAIDNHRAFNRFN